MLKAVRQVFRHAIPKFVRNRIRVFLNGNPPDPWAVDWNAILQSDGFYHWRDIRLDLRRDSKTLFIKDEIFESGEYDFKHPRDCVVIDIGMNIGDTPLFFARMPNVRKVYAFEPMKSTYDWALENFALNKHISDKIIAENVGVSDSDGEVEIDFDFQDGTGGATIEVVNEEHAKVISEASYILKDVAKKSHLIQVRSAVDIVRSVIGKNPGLDVVLKCDAEGAEWKIIPALASADLLSSCKLLMLEYHYNDPAPLIETLTGAGFSSYIRNLSYVKGAEIGNIYSVRSI